MKHNGQELSATSIAEKVENYQQVTEKGDGVFVGATPAEDAYFPVDGSAVDFVAYYPYKKTISGFSYPIDVTSQSDLTAIDLLYSDNVVNLTKAAPQVAFTFSHRLANLVVTLTAGDGLTTADLTNAKVSLSGQKTQGSMALATGIVTPSTAQTAKQIIDFKMTGTSASAIVLPSAATEGRKLIMTFSTGEVFEWGIPSTTAFDSGSRYIYHITLNRTKIYVTSTITDWTAGNGSGDNGNASMTDL
jgi:endonuclease G